MRHQLRAIMRSLPRDLKASPLKKEGEPVDFDDLTDDEYEHPTKKAGVFSCKVLEPGIVQLQSTDDARTVTIQYHDGILHGPIEYVDRDKAESITAMAIGGALCGRVDMREGSEVTQSAVFDERSTSHVLTVFSKSKINSKSRCYFGEIEGFHEVYNIKSGNLIYTSTFRKNLKDGAECTWFARSNNLRKAVTYIREHAHSRYVAMHADSSPAEAGLSFLGQATGKWSVWSTGTVKGHKPQPETFPVREPALTVDWLRTFLYNNKLNTKPFKVKNETITRPKTFGVDEPARVKTYKSASSLPPLEEDPF